LLRGDFDPFKFFSLCSLCFLGPLSPLSSIGSVLLGVLILQNLMQVIDLIKNLSVPGGLVILLDELLQIVFPLLHQLRIENLFLLRRWGLRV